MKAKRAALYLRVSTDEQTTDNQRQALEATAEQRGWTVVKAYEDDGISGSKGRDKRPGLDEMLKDTTRGKFEVVLCWSVDRLGRSLADLIAGLQEIHSARVDLVLHQQAIDTTTPAGKAMFQMLGVFSLRTSHAGVDAGDNHRPLELAEHAEHLKHRFTGRGCCVDCLLMQHQVNAGTVKFL